MVQLNCIEDGCTFVSQDLPFDQAERILTMHLNRKHPIPSPSQALTTSLSASLSCSAQYQSEPYTNKNNLPKKELVMGNDLSPDVICEGESESCNFRGEAVIKVESPGIPDNVNNLGSSFGVLSDAKMPDSSAVVSPTSPPTKRVHQAGNTPRCLLFSGREEVRSKQTFIRPAGGTPKRVKSPKPGGLAEAVLEASTKRKSINKQTFIQPTGSTTSPAPTTSLSVPITCSDQNQSKPNTNNNNFPRPITYRRTVPKQELVLGNAVSPEVICEGGSEYIESGISDDDNNNLEESSGVQSDAKMSDSSAGDSPAIPVRAGFTPRCLLFGGREGVRLECENQNVIKLKKTSIRPSGSTPKSAKFSPKLGGLAEAVIETSTNMKSISPLKRSTKWLKANIKDLETDTETRLHPTRVKFWASEANIKDLEADTETRLRPTKRVKFSPKLGGMEASDNRKSNNKKTCEDLQGGDLFIRIKGLELTSTEDDVRRFLADVSIVELIMSRSDRGKPTGEAFLMLQTEADTEAAMKYDMEYFGSRIVVIEEVFEEQFNLVKQMDKIQKNLPFPLSD